MSGTIRHIDYKPVAGDIILMRAGDASWAKKIRRYQRFARGSSKMVHAHIVALDRGMGMGFNGIIEEFISADHTLDIFRCNIDTVALSAGKNADRMLKLAERNVIKISYDDNYLSAFLGTTKAKTIRSLGDCLRVSYGKGCVATCTSIVVACYQLALSQHTSTTSTDILKKMFDMESHCYYPSMLHDLLKKNPSVFKFIGRKQTESREELMGPNLIENPLDVSPDSPDNLGRTRFRDGIPFTDL